MDDGKSEVPVGWTGFAVSPDGEFRLFLPREVMENEDTEVPDHMLAVAECALRMSDPEWVAEMAAAFVTREEE